MSEAGDAEGRRMTPFSEHRLPRGRHRLPRAFVADNQRWRLIGAAAEVLAERGYGEATARLVVSRAAVSSSTFYGHFGGLSDLIAATFEVAAAALLEVVAPTCRFQPPQRRRLEMLQVVSSFAEEEPHLAHLLGLEVAAALVEIAVARERLLDRLTELGVGSAKPASCAARAAYAAALALTLGSRVDGASLPELVELLTFVEAGSGG